MSRALQTEVQYLDSACWSVRVPPGHLCHPVIVELDNRKQRDWCFSLFGFPTFSLFQHFFLLSEWSLKAKQLTLPLFALLKKIKMKRLITSASRFQRDIFNANEIREPRASLEGRYNINNINIIIILINSYHRMFGSRQNVNFYLKHQSTTPEITGEFHR